MLTDRCPGCGEATDTEATVCRVCGERLTITTGPADVEEEPYQAPQFLDRLGEWSEIKHDIIESYARAYTTILSKQASIQRYIYIDCFAGAGVATDRQTGELLPGSAYRMLMDVDPPFSEYHFIELDQQKADHLGDMFGADPRVHIHVGDANTILPRDVLPRCRYEDYARALCLLDPYGLTVNWATVHAMGQMKSVEVFYNFMIVGANRNVLWRDPTRVSPERRELLTRVIGDEAAWMRAAYREVTNLFGDQLQEKIQGNDAIVNVFRQRLKDVAGFAYVPEPVPMKNSQNAVIYYLYFATQNDTARRIVSQILNKYRH